jgi:hypothetical protein
VNDAGQSPRSIGEEPGWQLRVAGLLLTIDRLPDSRWVALYGGFSRVEGERLPEVIAVAAGAQMHERWIAELVELIESESRKGRSPHGGSPGYSSGNRGAEGYSRVTASVPQL